jgi:hypothetical protein
MKKIVLFLYLFAGLLAQAGNNGPYPSGGGTVGGITNGQATIYASTVNTLNPGIKLLPPNWFGFGDSITCQLRTNGWFSQGGYTNQYSATVYTNGFLHYNVGAYPSNNVSYFDVLTNILWIKHSITLNVDLAGCVPGLTGSSLWGTYNGSNYVALPSLYATKNIDQINGFTYNAAGYFTNANGFHGDPVPLTYWPDPADVWVNIQGTTYSNLNNTPISITVTGAAYNQMVFFGTPNAISTGKGTLPYRAGQASQSKYAPPYTSACNAFNLVGNIPVGIWALSNAPTITGIPAGAFVQAGANDLGLTTNALAYTTNQCNFADYLHGLGFYPVILISTVNSPGANSYEAGVTVTNYVNAERQLWPGHFDYFYDLQASNGISGMFTGANYVDGSVHFSPTYAGYVGTNMNLGLNWNSLSYAPLAAGAGGAFDGSSVTNLGGLFAHIPAAITVGASPFNFTNNSVYTLECYFSGATAYSITKNGAAVYSSLAGDNYFLLAPTNRCAITYTVAPTMLTNALY